MQHTEEDVKLLARLMRVEAEGECDDELGMLMVRNTGVNHVRSDCLDFTKLRNLRDMAYQSQVVLKQHKRDIFINVQGS